MPGAPTKRFTSNHALRADGGLDFACSRDAALWPWTALDPHHPGAIQALGYWVAVECAMALGNWDPDKWSALTWTRWRCGKAGAGRFAGGRYARTTIDGKEAFSIDMHDAAHDPICRLEGRGVIFRTRDFEKWRARDKAVAHRQSSEGFVFAEEKLLGLAPGERPFLGPLEEGCAPALLDRGNALPPGHPWLDGSGDHVNSAHLAEVARQFVSLLRGGEAFVVEQAEMRFDRYVELGVPFDVARCDRADSDGIAMRIVQGGRDCTSITYRIRSGEAA